MLTSGNWPENHKHLEAQARLLEARLERLSVDSSWARRSSGLRGSHVETVYDLSDELASAIFKTTVRVTRAVRKASLNTNRN